MSETSIDDNSRNTLSAYNETTGLTEDTLVDPITGALLLFGVIDTGGTFTELDHAKIDENGRNTLSAWNDSTGKIEALRCSGSGELLITIV